MAQLRDFIDASSQRGLLGRSIVPGHVLYLKVHFVDHPKYLVVLTCSARQPRLVFAINSEIAPYVRLRPELQACQVIITAHDHPFLDHDSYIDCGNVFQFDESNVVAQVRKKPERCCGELEPSVRQAVIEMIQRATTIEPKHLARIRSDFIGE